MDDDVDEDQESFSAELMLASIDVENVLIAPDNTEILIEDNDGE